jgi:hypothetical protein
MTISILSTDISLVPGSRDYPTPAYEAEPQLQRQVQVEMVV